MTEGPSHLLRELALLLRRHPPEDFEELARLLGTPDFASALSHALAELASASRRAKGKGRAPSLSDILETVRSKDEARYDLLKAAQEKLFDKRLHGSLAHLIEAIETSGVHLPKKSYRRREDVVLAFIRSASGMHIDDLGRALDKLGTPKVPSDLRSWSSIIVPKKEMPGAG
jgi:hypothetical protein